MLRILQQLDSLQDLLAVFKRHELELVQSVLWKISPAAWELYTLGWRHFTGGKCRCTQTVPPILRSQHAYNSQNQKSFPNILQTLLRPEPVRMLSGKTKVGVERFDDAIFRVWTFCQFLGPGRTENMTRRLDPWRNAYMLGQRIMCNEKFEGSGLRLSELARILTLFPRDRKDEKLLENFQFSIVNKTFE